ncbi:MAG: Abi family protein [Erysipelotrichaceae bacterium]|nr:Abi family protein [Erysipelotrichaceae bacterium]
MKPFKTIDEQLDLLKSRGLIFTNEDKAKQYLLNNNYYNVINCYAKFFMVDDDRFIPGTNFDEIIQVHYYDKEIKSIFFKSILEIEKHLKSILSYRFSEKYKDKKYAYLNVQNYNSDNILDVIKTISYLSSIINNYKYKRNNSINHYINRHDDVPFWILTNYMNFGQPLYFYNYLDDSLKNEIAKDFSSFLTSNLEIESIFLTSEHLVSFLEVIHDLRNIVAHNNKLLGYHCRGRHVRYLYELHNKYAITRDSRRDDVYNVFIVMQAYLSKNQYATLHNTLLNNTNHLCTKLHTIDVNVILQSLGFPNNWYETTFLPLSSDE